jgi:hypothetical protein
LTIDVLAVDVLTIDVLTVDVLTIDVLTIDVLTIDVFISIFLLLFTIPLHQKSLHHYINHHYINHHYINHHYINHHYINHHYINHHYITTSSPKFMKTMRIFSFVGLLMGLCLAGFVSACKKSTTGVPVSGLAGEWVRVQANEPQAYGGMRLSLENGLGTLLDSMGEFAKGRLKWRNITLVKDTIYSFQDLGSDSKYYDGRLLLYRASTGEQFLFTDLNTSADGEAQIWKKQ